MKLLALSGSARAASTNTSLLRWVSRQAPVGVSIELFQGIERLPIFTPDREGEHTPADVLAFCQAVADCNGVLIASPEYVRAIPGGLKNAIDWLVSRDEISEKPVALLHASHRGDDMLAALRLVLGTVTTHFNEACFARFPLMSLSPDEVATTLEAPEHIARCALFLDEFDTYVRASAG